MGMREHWILPEKTGMFGLLAFYISVFLLFGVGFYLLYVGLTYVHPCCTANIDRWNGVRVLLGAVCVFAGIINVKILLNSLEKG